MTRSLRILLLSTSLASVAALAFMHSSPLASADANSDDSSGPELRAVSIVHGMTFSLTQNELAPGPQGQTTMITRVNSAVPPGPPNINGAIPPGPPNIDLVVRVVAPDMEIAHAAGALTALGLMRGLTLQQIAGTFAQLNWAVQIKKVTGQVDPASYIDATKAGALGQLLISTIIAGDRPGGGCDAAIPFIQQGAAALGFPTSCPQ